MNAVANKTYRSCKMDEKHSTKASYTVDSVEERLDAPSPTSDARKLSTTATQDDRLFPWLEAPNQKFSAKAILRFPLMAALSIIGSALTVVLSALVLHFFDGKPIVTGHMPKPAAWISIILSLNSVLVHIAVTQGRTGKIVLQIDNV